MGVCSSKGVAVGNEEHGTADSAASLIGASQFVGSGIHSSTASQLRASAKAAWQASAKNMCSSRSGSQERSDKYDIRSVGVGLFSPVEDEIADNARRGSWPGGFSMRNSTRAPRTPAVVGSNVAWHPSPLELQQQDGQRIQCLTDSAKVEDSSGTDEAFEDADTGNSCVRSFYVRHNGICRIGEGEGDRQPECVEGNQPSGSGSQRRLRAIVTNGAANVVSSSFAVDLAASGVCEHPSGRTVCGPLSVPTLAPFSINNVPLETHSPVPSTSPPATGAGARRPNGDGGWTAQPQPTKAAAAVAAAVVTQPSPAPLATAFPAAAPAVGTLVDAASPTTPSTAAVVAVNPASRIPSAIGSGDCVQWVIRPGPPVESAYELGEVLGKGSFGVVRNATHLVSGSRVAVKTIRKSLLAATDISSLRREVQILHHLSGHPAISQLLGVYEEPSQLHLVMELYLGGDLFDALIAVGRHSERAAADVMRTVLMAISYCHAMGVVHRDIKPENFMLTSPLKPPAGRGTPAGELMNPQPQQQLHGETLSHITTTEAAGGPGGDTTLPSKLKLIDFGLSTFCSDSEPLNDTVGTSYYVAPEVLMRCYRRSADVWSAGVILHLLLTGYAPFDGPNDQEILQAVQTGKLDFTSDPIWTSISRDAIAVLTAMLTRDPDKRATADQLLAMPWLGRTASDCTASSAPLPGVVSERMRRFARMHSFKKEARRVVAALMQPEEVEGLVMQFKALDVDGDGRLTVHELRNGLARQELQSTRGAHGADAVLERTPARGGGGAECSNLVEPLQEDEMQEIVDRSDLNGDGLLDQSEFLGASLANHVIKRQAQQATAASTTAVALGRARSHTTAPPAGAVLTNPLAAAFAHFDADGSGFITPDELRSALACHHPDSQGPDVRALLSQVDRDADGRISYLEFLDMLVQEPDEVQTGPHGCTAGSGAAITSDPRLHGGGNSGKARWATAAAMLSGRTDVTPQQAHGGTRQVVGQAPPPTGLRGIRAGPNTAEVYALDSGSVRMGVQHDGGRSSRGGGGGAAATKLRVPGPGPVPGPGGTWGGGAPSLAHPVPTPGGGGVRGRYAARQGPVTGLRSPAAVISGSRRLSPIACGHECSSPLGGGGEGRGRSGHGDDSDWACGDTEAKRRGSYLVVAKAAALPLACDEAAPGGPGYLASRPQVIVTPPQPAFARRARRHSAADALDDGYVAGCSGGGGGGGRGDGSGGGGGGVRVLRTSEGQASDHHTLSINCPHQVSAVHPGAVHVRGGGAVRPSLLGGHRSCNNNNNRQMLYGIEDTVASAQPRTHHRGAANGQQSHYNGISGGSISSPKEPLQLPFVDACEVSGGGGGGSRHRGGTLHPQPPRAQGPLDGTGIPCGRGSEGGGRTVQSRRKSAETGCSYPQLFGAMHGSGVASAIPVGCRDGGGLDESAVLPPGACSDDCYPGVEQYVNPAAAAAAVVGRNRRSVGPLEPGATPQQPSYPSDYRHQQHQQRQTLYPELSVDAGGLMMITTGRCSQYGGGLLTEPLPDIGGKFGICGASSGSTSTYGSPWQPQAGRGEASTAAVAVVCPLGVEARSPLPS